MAIGEKFCITRIGDELSGFQITFKNNKTLSVQFSRYHYCKNRDRPFLPVSKSFPLCSPNAEIAIIDEWSGKFITSKCVKTNDDVVGWVSPDELPKIMSCVAKL